MCSAGSAPGEEVNPAIAQILTERKGIINVAVMRAPGEDEPVFVWQTMGADGWSEEAAPAQG